MTRWFRIRIVGAAVLALLILSMAGLGLVARAGDKPYAKPSQPAAAQPVATAQPAKAKIKQIIPILKVQDIGVSMDYYINTLGMQKEWEWGDPTEFASVGGEGFSVFLQQDNPQSVASQTIYVEVDNVDSVFQHVKAHGGEVAQAPTDCPWGMREMHMKDPSGHLIRIGSPLPKAEQPVRKPN